MKVYSIPFTCHRSIQFYSNAILIAFFRELNKKEADV